MSASWPVRGVGLGGGKARPSRSNGRQGLPALVAELGSGGKFNAAGRALLGQASTAVQAELGLRRVLVLTLGTLHPGLPIACPLQGWNGRARLDRSPFCGQLDLRRSAVSGSPIIRGAPIWHIVTAGYAVRASPSKGRRVSQGSSNHVFQALCISFELSVASQSAALVAEPSDDPPSVDGRQPKVFTGFFRAPRRRILRGFRFLLTEEQHRIGVTRSFASRPTSLVGVRRSASHP